MRVVFCSVCGVRGGVGGFALAVALGGACSAVSHRSGGGSGASSEGNGGGSTVLFQDAGQDGAPCALSCSLDLHAVIDCTDTVVEECSGLQGCDRSLGLCAGACQAAVHNKQSVGCDYYATDMDMYVDDANTCFAAVVANTWNVPAHLQVEWAGKALPLSSFARIPSGAGPSLKYLAFDPVLGVPPGEVAILFLAGSPSSLVPCPAPAAVPTGAQILQASGVGHAFHITSDVPVVAYEVNPFGGGSAAVTGASLLLPTSVWDTNYVAVTASPQSSAPPSMNIVAAEDNTHITMLPTVAVQGGGSLPPGPAQVPYTFTLQKGEQAQFTQGADLTGSILQSDRPIGFMAGQPCMNAPAGIATCDHGEQMVPPIKALGSEYVGVMFRPRVTGDQAIWHLVGTVDGTHLLYSHDVGGPSALQAGQAMDFVTDQPFRIKSQDEHHPFLLLTTMSGSQWKPGMEGYGDPDLVLSVPPAQYASHYVFFTDPTYPETNLVVVRTQQKGEFKDVILDCAGPLGGWQPVGEYAWTRFDLMTHDFKEVGTCSTGRHEIKSQAPFGLWVWGWGTPETTSYTRGVSYGYPGGMKAEPINGVVIPPAPK